MTNERNTNKKTVKSVKMQGRKEPAWWESISFSTEENWEAEASIRDAIRKNGYISATKL